MGPYGTKGPAIVPGIGPVRLKISLDAEWSRAAGRAIAVESNGESGRVRVLAEIQLARFG